MCIGLQFIFLTLPPSTRSGLNASKSEGENVVLFPRHLRVVYDSFILCPRESECTMDAF